MEELLINQEKKTNVAFLGIGWIGLNRMQAANKAGHIHIMAMADPNPENVKLALDACGEDTPVYDDLDDLLETAPEGLVIATPSALHASQALAALNKGIAVFCQKPLGRNAEETRTIISLAKERNLLLGVDFSYRYTCFNLLNQKIKQGEIGKVYSMELCFHNAYGPDKEWFYHKDLSGGGCVIDLGVHLIDLALWCLEDQDQLEVKQVSLFAKGKKLSASTDEVEDHAMITLGNDSCSIQLNCSWNLPAGKEAEIYCNIYGEYGGYSFRNINGSFYDFEALRLSGTHTEKMFSGSDNWGGRAISEWCNQLDQGMGFDPEIERVAKVAEIIDQIYEKA